jgi:pimeloyl-ACP methyl ester carboxylesterase
MTKPTSVSRRVVLAGAAASLAAPTVLSTAQGQASRRTYVCLSAAWAGGWIWSRVAERLRARGHRVLTPTFTGLGERSHLLASGVNLDTHIADVVNTIRWEDLKEATLVPHSYAGIVGAGVIEQTLPALASVIFVDAFMPESGASLLSSASPRFRETIEAAIAKGESAVKPVPASVFAINEKDRAWFDAKATPHPLAALRQPVTLTGARERVPRKAYIRAVAYEQASFQTHYETLRKDPAWRTATIAGGHCPMIDQPERLAQLLEELG